jgi:predicted acylesterase/phospholipase RssA/CRP-like cAMP-binding protein
MNVSEDIINAVKNCKVFASLDPNGEVFQALISQFHKVSLKAGQVLFYQGDPSDFLYILVTGSVTAYLTTSEDHKPRMIGHLQPSDVVGELGTLSGDPRSLTLKATEDCLLLRLPGYTFQKLCRQFPAILFETLHPVISRSQQIISQLSSGEKKKHIALIPANDDIETLAHFEKTLKEVISHYKKVAFFSESEIHSDRRKTPTNFDSLIIETERSNAVIVYLLKPFETPLSKACWARLSKIYVIVDGNAKPNFNEYVLGKLQNTRHLIEMRRELILLYRENTQPTDTQAFLDQGAFFLHHHIRLNDIEDYQRLFRFIRGKAFGLVLSGGGAKGWAHIGALKALLEAKIPIDAIGGVSAGSLVGSLFTITQDYEKIYEYFGRLISASHRVVSFRNICWPAISLFQCRDFTLELQRILGDVLIENMLLPFFTVSCNLGVYKEVTHTSGFLWEKNRASTAVPGLIPPMVMLGELHIDGGVINNLPTNTMRDLLGPEGKIIAVELMNQIIDKHQYNFPPTLTFKQAILAKMHLSFKDYKFPPFGETFVKALLVGSSTRQKENTLIADLLITPDTTPYSMVRLNKKEDQDTLVQLGYDAAIQSIKDWNYKR